MRLSAGTIAYGEELTRKSQETRSLLLSARHIYRTWGTEKTPTTTPPSFGKTPCKVYYLHFTVNVMKLRTSLSALELVYFL